MRMYELTGLQLMPGVQPVVNLLSGIPSESVSLLHSCPFPINPLGHYKQNK